MTAIAYRTGRELIRHTRAALGPCCKIVLLTAPAAVGSYPKLGFAPHPSAWILPETRSIS
jgi:hypothetical protein